MSAMHFLTLEEAARSYEALALAVRPATLHPHYVLADAARHPMLQPAFLYFEHGGESWMHCLHLTEIAGTGLRDASSAYGYGGPVCTTSDESFHRLAWNAYVDWMREQRVVVEYIRFHPALGNERFYGGQWGDNREVVTVDLGSDDLFASYALRTRQAVRKALAGGLVYSECNLKENSAAFGDYYRMAMRAMQSDPFYLFDDAYFDRLASGGSFARLAVCSHASRPDAWLAAALFLDGAGLREYHLAAASADGRKVGASSFLLHEAAIAARRIGQRQLYLGGGTDAAPDNALLFFKSGFSRERLVYRTGATVFDSRAYDELKAQFPAEWAAHPERPIFYRKV